MRILFLSDTLPHSQVVSGVIIVNKRIRLLAERGHQVGLAAFLRPGDEPHVPEVRAMVSDLELLPPPRPRRASCVAGLLTGSRPPPFCADYSPAMRETVGRMIERTHYQVVIAEFSTTPICPLCGGSSRATVA